MAGKLAVAVVSCRRGGASAASPRLRGSSAIDLISCLVYVDGLSFERPSTRVVPVWFDSGFAFLNFTPTLQSKTLSSLLWFVAVCSSLSCLHPVSKTGEIPWGQIWVTVFRVVRGYFAGHGGSRQTASSNRWPHGHHMSRGGRDGASFLTVREKRPSGKADSK